MLSLVSTLPSGTVTFLFSDIEGSTLRLRELGDDYAGLLTEHRRCVRSAFGEPERLYQVGSGSFPPPRPLDATNIPVPANALVGRNREVTELLELFSGPRRLVTLIGPGGTGKTRLAIEVAGELVGKVSDGVF